MTETNLVRCPDVAIAEQMISEIEKTKKEGDTIGGEITVVATGVPAGWGEPVFDKLHADIGKGMLSLMQYMDLNMVLVEWIFLLVKEVK